MKYTVLTIAFLASTVGALAADLPSKKIPLPPTVVREDTTLPYFVGVNFGSNDDKTRAYSGGISAGVFTNEFLATELTYDYVRPGVVANKRDSKQTVAVNALPQLRLFSTPVSVYGLAGVGYAWDSVSRDHSVYNVGGGVKYEFAHNLEFDTRYRHTDAFDKKDRNSDDRVTLGVNYKF